MFAVKIPNIRRKFAVNSVDNHRKKERIKIDTLLWRVVLCGLAHDVLSECTVAEAFDYHATVVISDACAVNAVAFDNLDVAFAVQDIVNA